MTKGPLTVKSSYLIWSGSVLSEYPLLGSCGHRLINSRDAAVVLMAIAVPFVELLIVFILRLLVLGCT